MIVKKPLHLCFAVLASSAPCALAMQSMSYSRAEVAAQLEQAEDARASYRLESSITYEYDVPGYEKTLVNVCERLADGTGRFRQEMTSQRNASISTERLTIHCWNGVERRVDHYTVGSDGPHNVNFTFNHDTTGHYDEVENALGLAIRCQVSDLTPRLRPSAAIADSKTPVTIESTSVNGSERVRVRIVGPWSGVGNTYIYEFDPQRQWLVTFVEIRVHSSLEDRDADLSRYVMQYRATQAVQIDGVWMPTEVKMNTGMAETTDEVLDMTEYPATLRLRNIELNPEVHDGDFTISLDGLPMGTSVADGRLGISYRLGSNLIFADGVLNEVSEPVLAEIDSTQMVELLSSAKQHIDPGLEQANLKSVRKDPWRWLTWVAGAGAMGSLGFAAWVMFQRRQSFGAGT